MCAFFFSSVSKRSLKSKSTNQGGKNLEKHGKQGPQIRLAYVNECGAGLLFYLYIYIYILECDPILYRDSSCSTSQMLLKSALRFVI